ncbi:AAA family ATPase [Kitasatospora cineracea]
MTTTGTPHIPAHRPEPAGTGPVAAGPPSAGDLLEGFPSMGGAVELFPVNFTAYQHHRNLETDEHVRKIALLLAPYGLHINRWTVSGDRRDRQAVEDRLGTWKRPDGGYGNTVLYWVGHGNAENLAHHRTLAPIDDGITPHEVARAIGSRQLHPDAEDSWAIVVLDACFSHDFAQTVHSELINKYGRAERYLLLSTAAKGHAELGTFTHALERALTVTFRGQPAIGLAALGSELEEELGGYRGDRASNRRDRLVRHTPDVAASVTAPLDQLAELQAVIDQLPTDEQRHFLPKASGAELGELAWYFQGRTLQRDQVLHWLTTATSGALVVTGPAGAGKSALLGHVLLHTNTRLRGVLIRHGHLTPLPAGVPCPDDPFDLTAHLSGLTPVRTLQLVAEAAGLTDLADLAADGQPPADLASRLLAALRARQEPLTLLFDALDEAEQPLVIADQILRPLAALPAVRLIIGTRRSTREGPDQPTPDNEDILDTLRPQLAEAEGNQAVGLQEVEVTQDQEALAGYLRAKLNAAKRRDALDADDTLIATAVHRLVTDHQQAGVEPQQFLYARLAVHELLNDPALLTDPTPLIGRTHRQLFAHALERLHRTNPHYVPLLRALGLAQGRGLPDQDGIWTCTADALTPGGEGSTSGSIPGLVRDAAPYLVLDQEHGQSVYRLAHRTFTERFTTTLDAPAAHAAITTALTLYARHTLDTRSPSGGTAPQPEDVSPYIRYHLIAHARLGHAVGALHALADHPDVLDTLDLTSITTTALHRGLPPNEIPPAIAGTALLQNHAQAADSDQQDHDLIGWRQWWRRLGATYIQGTPPPAETHARRAQAWPPNLTAGTVRRRQLHLQLTGHTGHVRAVAVFSAPDGTPLFATGSADGSLRIWDPATGAQVGGPFTGHAGGVQAVAVFSAPDGTPRLVSAGNDQVVRIWDPATGAQDGEPLTGHTSGIQAVAVFSAPDGTPRLVSASPDNTVRIWDPAAGAQVGEPLTGHAGGVWAVGVFSAPDGTPRLATGSADGSVRIWDPATGTQVGGPFTGHTSAVSTVAAFTAPDGTPRLVSAGGDWSVRIWDPATGAQDGEPLTGHTDWVQAVAAFTAPDGTPRLVSASDDGTVRIWDPATSTQDGEPLTGHIHQVRTVAAFTAPDGTPRLVSASDDGTVRIWDPATSTQDGEPLTGHTDVVQTAAVFSAPDGTSRLATGSADGTVRIWNPATGAQDGEPLTGHTDWVRAVGVFSAPDGTPRLATGSADGTVRIWDPATGAQVAGPFTGHAGGVQAVAVFTAPDGTPRLVSAGGDWSVRIWDPATGAQVAGPFTGHTNWVRAVAVFTAPDGTPRLVSAGNDQTVRIWDPAAGAQVGEPLVGHTGGVWAVGVFTAPDGTPRLATGSADGSVRIWDPVTGAQEGPPLTGHTGGVRAVAVLTAPDGTPRLVSAGNDEAVRIWNLRTRRAHALFLTDQVHTLVEDRGLLIAGTGSGYLAIDISSVPTDTA